MNLLKQALYPSNITCRGSDPTNYKIFFRVLLSNRLNQICTSFAPKCKLGIEYGTCLVQLRHQSYDYDAKFVPSSTNAMQCIALQKFGA